VIVHLLLLMVFTGTATVIAEERIDLSISVLDLQDVELQRLDGKILVKGYLALDVSRLRLYLSEPDAFMRNNVHAAIVEVTYRDQLLIEKRCTDSYVAIFGIGKYAEHLKKNVIVPHEISTYKKSEDGKIVVDICWQRYEQEE